MGFPMIRKVTMQSKWFKGGQRRASNIYTYDLFFLTSIVVTMSVLLASVSEALRSREVEFMASVLLEYQIPICPPRRKKSTKRVKRKKQEARGIAMSPAAVNKALQSWLRLGHSAVPRLSHWKEADPAF